MPTAGALSLPIGDPLTAQWYERELAVLAPKNSLLMELGEGFIGSDANNAIQIKNDTKEQGGKSITYGLRGRLTGGGIPNGTPAEGNETNIQFFNDTVNIGFLRQATKDDGQVTTQNALFDTRKAQLEEHANWWGQRFDETVISRLAGTLGSIDGVNSAASPSTNTWEMIDTTDSAEYNWDNNSYVAPTRLIFADGVSAAGSLTSANDFKLPDIYRMSRAARRATSVGFRRIDPIKAGGKKIFFLMVPTYVGDRLQTQTSGQWYDVERAKIQGGFKDSAFLDGSLGVWKTLEGFHVVVIAHESVPIFDKDDTVITGRSVDTGRCLLLGRQAGTMAFGRYSKGYGKFVMVEKKHDYDNTLGICTGSYWGVKKTEFNNTQGSTSPKTDNGVQALDAYIVAA